MRGLLSSVNTVTCSDMVVASAPTRLRRPTPSLDLVRPASASVRRELASAAMAQLRPATTAQRRPATAAQLRPVAAQSALRPSTASDRGGSARCSSAAKAPGASSSQASSARGAALTPTAPTGERPTSISAAYFGGPLGISGNDASPSTTNSAQQLPPQRPQPPPSTPSPEQQQRCQRRPATAHYSRNINPRPTKSEVRACPIIHLCSPRLKLCHPLVL